MRTPSRQIPTQRQAKQAFGWGKPQNKNARTGVDPVWALKSEGAGDNLEPSVEGLGVSSSATPDSKAPTDRGFAHRQDKFTPPWGYCLSPLPAFSVGPKKSHFSRINIMTTESNSSSQARIEALQNALKGVSALVSDIGPKIVAVARAGHLGFQTSWGVADTETAAHLFELVESLAGDLVVETESLERGVECLVPDDRAAARHAARLAKREGDQ